MIKRLTYAGYLAIIGLFFQSHVCAQSAVSLGLDINAGGKGFPIHGKFGVGLSLEYVKMLSDNGGIRLFAGYDHFDQRFPGADPRTLLDSLKSLGLNGYDFSILPIRIGYQYNLFKKGPFAYAEAGVSHIFTKYEHPALSKNIFTYAAGIAYRLLFKNETCLQYSVCYNYNHVNKYLNRNYIAFRVAYGLALRKPTR